MIRVGLVNMDTSHPRAFAEVMKKTGRIGYHVIYDDSFRTPEEIDNFIQKYGLIKRCSQMDELVELSDIGFIQGCNWDKHLSYAEAFLRKGKPVFIDKPLVGCLEDCRRILEWADSGAMILGASSTRYASEILDFLKIPVSERGEVLTVYGSVGVDEFNYGIHVVEAIGGILGAGAEWVDFIGRGEAQNRVSFSYAIGFRNGKNAIFTIAEGNWQPFTLQIVTTKSTYQLNLNPENLYEGLINQICNCLEKKDNHMANPEELVESIEIMIAAAKSRHIGKRVYLKKMDEYYKPYDGRTFWENYQKSY